jgi:hypothetical protein
MPAEEFWRIIERATESAHEPDAHVAALRMALCELTLEEITSFEAAFRKYLNKAYTWDLCGAAYVINGYCSDDTFEYFRRWLVSRGRAVYEGAVANPDSLAQLGARLGPDGAWEFEEIYHVALRVFEDKGGEGDMRDHVEPEAGLWGGPGPSGEPLPEDDGDLAQRYPRLWQRFRAKPRG